MTRRPKPVDVWQGYGSGNPWPEPCQHEATITVHIPASGGYVDGKSVMTPARDVVKCASCGRVMT